MKKAFELDPLVRPVHNQLKRVSLLNGPVCCENGNHPRLFRLSFRDERLPRAFVVGNRLRSEVQVTYFLVLAWPVVTVMILNAKNSEIIVNRVRWIAVDMMKVNTDFRALADAASPCIGFNEPISLQLKGIFPYHVFPGIVIDRVANERHVKSKKSETPDDFQCTSLV